MNHDSARECQRCADLERRVARGEQRDYPRKLTPDERDQYEQTLLASRG
jgi:hypothetical protein